MASPVAQIVVTADGLVALTKLRERTAELNDANSFMEAILTSLQAGVVVLDREMHILVWNRRCEDLWGLRADEAVGQHFLNLDVGLSTGQLRPAIRDVLTGRSEREESEQTAVNRRGRTVELRVVCTPLTSEASGVIGAILVRRWARVRIRRLTVRFRPDRHSVGPRGRSWT
ncbi:PAS domain-containing protein [Dactylosporangium matsuzakiense]|uniref:PAS domain-containing protein n=1 Tax=Dactylosporangium matsuzakiense TaxID=53360 RepID=A0A9W6NRM4_9ACTN|nr:PAS domain-containing protein [Dactylosporangium matsuzakiense]GLL06734.1 hypothetical protein GCM10017581_084840 [Dactylosporangium matsuzakiense]